MTGSNTPKQDRVEKRGGYTGSQPGVDMAPPPQKIPAAAPRPAVIPKSTSGKSK